MPWRYQRHLIARRLGFRLARELDDLPHCDIEEELAMRDLEDDVKRQRPQGGMQP